MFSRKFLKNLGCENFLKSQKFCENTENILWKFTPKKFNENSEKMWKVCSKVVKISWKVLKNLPIILKEVYDITKKI